MNLGNYKNKKKEILLASELAKELSANRGRSSNLSGFSRVWSHHSIKSHIMNVILDIISILVFK